MPGDTGVVRGMLAVAVPKIVLHGAQAVPWSAR